MAVSPDNPNYILINVRNSKNGVTHGIYESNDGGDTWNITILIQKIFLGVG